MKTFIIYFLFFLSVNVFGNSPLDSLFNKAKKASLNEKVFYFNEISQKLEPINPTFAVEFTIANINLSQLLKNKKGEGEAYWNLGNAYETIGKYEEALESYEKGKQIAWSISDTNLAASCINNIGIIYSNQGKYDDAITYYKEALNIRLQKGVRSDIAISYNNIGNINFYKGDLEEAMKFYMLSLKIRNEINDTIGIQSTLNNIGNIKYYQGQLKEALEYYHKALKIRLSINDKIGVGSVYNNIATMHEELGNKEEAIRYYELSYKIKKEVGNIRGIASTATSYAGLYYNNKDFKKAIKIYHEALNYSIQVDDKSNIVYAQGGLSLCYSELKQLDSAMIYAESAIENALELDALGDLKYAYKCKSEVLMKSKKFEEALNFHIIHDSISNEMMSSDNLQAVSQMEAQFENEKKELEIENLKSKEKINEIEIAKEKNTKYAFGLGLVLTIIISIIAILGYIGKRKRNKIISKQKYEVEQQKEMLEEKNKEILDSIIYAKRIQSAILPPYKVVKEYLEDSFILYKPKDIVAGDFYWLEHQEGKVLFAAADCTGHGVPGAMVSVVCNNGLNRSVREHNLTIPGEILTKTREIVVQEFEKSEEEVKDGMDIALCCLEGNKLYYSGAHNPLWIIRNNSNEVEEIKADKQPIGKVDNPQPYKTHKVELSKGDTIYIFSDGYVDQFGGEKGKKLKTANFKNLLLTLQNENMQKQKELIDEAFEEWKGNLEQLDDVCVIGVRV